MASGSSLVQLADGRTLAYRTYGAADGAPVVFCHGNMNSSLFEPAWEKTGAAAVAAGARIFAPDRPGVGLSTHHPGRTYATWAHDVAQLADQEGLAGFSVMGFSSGGGAQPTHHHQHSPVARGRG